jgi:hypothetical protein
VLIRNNESAVYNDILQLIDSNKETTTGTALTDLKENWSVTPPSHKSRANRADRTTQPRAKRKRNTGKMQLKRSK